MNIPPSMTLPPSPVSLPCQLSHCSLADLESQITELAGQLNAANFRWLSLIGEFDRRQGWADGSLHSCAHWLNFKCGLDLGAAREKVRVAAALTGLPRIAAAMSRGELSYSKVRALTRVATTATEENLLMIALHGTAHHVEKVVRLFRRAQEAEELSREARQQATRAVEYWYDADGSLVLKARLPAMTGALLVKALESVVETLPATELNVEFGEEVPVSYPVRRADALVHVAEQFLKNASAPRNGADRYQVVVHVEVPTLERRSAGRCEIEDGPTLAAETVRRVACDSSVVPIFETPDGEVLDVGRKTRTVSPALRRALNARDAGCCFPGCTHGRYLDAHHVTHWAEGGHTKLDNLMSLCRTHHRLVHEGGVTVNARADGGWRFSRPDGREYEGLSPDGARACEWTALRDTHARLGISIDSETAVTRWRGERLDYDHSVWVLCHEQARCDHQLRMELDCSSADDGDVSAETSPSRNPATERECPSQRCGTLAEV